VKCLICGAKTSKRVLCSKHAGVDIPLQYLSVHTCNSFKQKDGDAQGICEYYLSCAPIKKALKREILMSGNLGHVICPHASTNLGKIIYSDVGEEEIRENYPECLE